MPISLTKDAIDLGIVVRDGEAALKFYRDTLGLEFLATTPMPGSTMHRLMCGKTMIKIVVPETVPDAKPTPGPISAATGYRYWTISVPSVAEITAKIAAAGYTVTVQPREIRPGVTISIVEDPEGNLVEFLQQA
jgi:glyoxylase I family protein